MIYLMGSHLVLHKQACTIKAGICRVQVTEWPPLGKKWLAQFEELVVPFFLSHLLIAGCHIGVQISVRPFVCPSTFTSKFGFLYISDS